MNIIITSKGINASNHLRNTIESKLAKLDKYFSKEIDAHITITLEKDRETLEATINVDGTIFRAVDSGSDAFTSIDAVVNKLSGQMSKYKSKLIRKHKDTKHIDFSALPDLPETDDNEIKIAKRKKFTLNPMSEEEAVLQMELIQHNFFVFLNVETNSIGIVYKRDRGDYGLLETEV
jgi:putative sigma-54 modulation protein